MCITGDIDGKTPFCVLKEIADIHGVKIPNNKSIKNKIVMRDFIDELINSHNLQPTIKSPWQSLKDKSFASKFVNKHVSWPDTELSIALEFLCKYMKKEYVLPPANFEYGLQIPSNPHSLNACVLYKLCKSVNLPIKRDLTIKNLAEAINMLITSPENSKNFIRSQIEYIPDKFLPVSYLNICNLVNIELENEDQDEVNVPDYYEDLSDSINLLSDHEKALKLVNPQTTGQAIYLAAINYKMDISSSTNPIKEYIFLRNYKINSEEWDPVDNFMKKQLKENPMSFRLDVFFNPSLPHTLYSDDILDKLAVEEGFSQVELQQDGAYQLLGLAYLTPTFYHGIYSSIINEKTPLSWEDITNIPKNCIICYGVKKDALTAFSYKELIDLFNVNKSFLNPINENKSSFSKIVIRKLKRICKTTHVGDTTISLNEKVLLLDSIEMAELFTEDGGVKIKNFYLEYNKTKTPVRQNVDNAINVLFKLSMYMRGWDNSFDDYPVENTPVYNQDEVDVRVTEYIIIFEKVCNKLGKIGETIMNLPIFKFKNGEWQRSTCNLEGLSIKDRLTILKNGEKHDNYNSCMRLTSNWFAASSYKYMQVMGMKPPFDINKLRDIS